MKYYMKYIDGRRELTTKDARADANVKNFTPQSLMQYKCMRDRTFATSSRLLLV